MRIITAPNSKKLQIKIMKRQRRRAPRIAIVFHHVLRQGNGEGLREHQIIDNDTTSTVQTVKKVLKKLNFPVQVIRFTGKDLTPLKKIRADYIFNLADSRQMEMRIAEVLERLQIPYSGSSYASIYNSNNKVRTKVLFERNHINTPKFSPVSLTTKITRSVLPSKFPMIVKPAYEHCSVGITDKSVVTTFKQLKSVIKSLRAKVRQMLIIEEFIRGREIQIVVLEKENQTVALTPAEMKFRGRTKSRWNIYGFTEKWNPRSRVYKNLFFEVPMRGVSAEIVRAMQRDAIRAFYIMGFRDYARFDLRYNPKTRQYYFLEGNANPDLSMNPDDAFMASLISAGMSFEDFIRTIIANALPFTLPKRHSV